MSPRWFTDASAGNPGAISPTLTVFEELNFKAILEFARNDANRGWENLRCLDAAGQRMHNMSVGWKSAPITEEMSAAIKSKNGVRQWHNHPSQDSLSDQDWRCTACETELELLALNERGSMFVGRIVDWDERLNMLLDGFPRLGSDLKMHMDKLSHQQRIDIEVRSRLRNFTGHVLNLALATCCPNVRYAYELTPDDQTIIDTYEELGIIQDGKNYALAEIKSDLAKAQMI